MLIRIIKYTTLLWCCAIIQPVIGQQLPNCLPGSLNLPIAKGEVNFNYGSGTDLYSNKNRSSATVGQPLIGDAFSNKNFTESGFWTRFLLPPQAPVLEVGQGDFPDRILIKWNLDPLSSSATNGYVITRDGSFLDQVDQEISQYIDFNVQAGEVYTYGVYGLNNFGKGAVGRALGFVNPNGVITGKVSTISGNPVPNCAVNLSPTTGTSLVFNGDDNIFVEYTDKFPTAQFTVSAWLKLEGSNDNTGIIDLGSVISKNWWLHTTSAVDGKGVKFGVGSGSSTEIQVVFPDSTKNNWHHIAATFNGANLLLYLDGELVGSAPAMISADSIPLYFGQKSAGNGFYNGKLDDVRILNKQLSQTEIQMTMDKSSSSKTNGLVAYWKMDEGVGSKTFDFSVNRLSAFLCGPTWSNDRAPVTSSGITDSKGFYIIEGINYKAGTTFTAQAAKSFFSNLSLEFNGVNSQWAELTNFDLPDSASIGVSIKPFDFANPQVILSKEDGGTKHFVLWLDGNQLKLTMASETYNFGLIPMGYHMLHFVLERQGSNTMVTYYLNGNLIGNHDFAGSASDWSGGTPWTLAKKQGSGADQQFFTGLIDEVVYYKDLLDLPTIQTINSLGTDPSSSALLSNFPLNEGEDTILTDLGQAMTGDGAIHGASWAMSARIMSATPHLFAPGTKLVTLNPSNTSVDGVDFQDQSTIPVSGFLRYSGTECFVEGAEVLVNGMHANPPAYTDKKGKFVIDLEPGKSVKLTPVFKNHVFSPGFWEVRKIASPIAGILFQDKTKRTVRGQLAGGKCRKSIILSTGLGATVSLQSKNQCYIQDIQVTEDNGKYVFTNVPPFEMEVTVPYHDDPTILNYFNDVVGGKTIDLGEKNDTVDFIYFSPPMVEMTPFDTNVCGQAMMVQGERQSVTIKVFQDYYGEKCYLENADLRIDNFLADLKSPTSFDTMMTDGKMRLSFKAGLPNIVAPYKQILSVTATANDIANNYNQEAVILGKRPRMVNFASTSPEIPMLILRDPPGDKSFSRIEKGTTKCSNIEFNCTEATTFTEGITFHAGREEEIAVGVGTEKTTKFEFQSDKSIEISVSQNTSFTKSLELCQTFTEAFQTDDGDILPGDSSDLFVGAAMNLLFGITDDLRWDTANCIFKVIPGMLIMPDKFATTFIYTDYHIRTVVIPNLMLTGDSASVKLWREMLARNEKLKKDAAFSENISFSAGTTYEKSSTSSTTSSETFSFEVEMAASLAGEFGFKVDGTGATFNLSLEASLGIGESKTTTNTKETTTFFTLGDDDIGDNFTVDILTDKTYSTPVFRTKSGASSCPYESKTVPRDEVALTVDKINQVNVLENDAAKYNFTLGNISQTSETRAYVIALGSSSNPKGAVVKANGTNLASPIGYQLPFGQGQEVQVTVERGPAGDYDYDSLEIALYVECHDDRYTALGLGSEQDQRFYKSIFIGAHFIEPCSKIDVGSPMNGWVHTVNSGINRFITLNKYDLSDDDLDYVLVQYRRTQGNGAWINIAEVPKADLQPVATIVVWNTSGLSDGQYEIRAVANCTGGVGVGISHVIGGKIERTAPELFGLPEPADGVLSTGDEISITFNEEIRCDLLLMADQTQNNNIGLYDSQTGNLIDFKMSCSGDKIIIVPNVPNRFLENRLLKVRVDSVKDLANNKFGQVEWEFNVDRNPLNWLDKAPVRMVKYEEDFVKIERKIENRGGQIVDWELKDLPSYCKIYPKAGLLLPGEVTVVNFEFDQSMVFGRNLDTIQLMGAEGNEPMIIDARVICHEPDWKINAHDWLYSMNFVLELNIEGVRSTDEEDIVGAFINGEMRGVARVKYYPALNKYLAFLTVYSNEFSGGEINMRIWDASSCQLFGSVVEKFTFDSDAVVGTPIGHQVIHTNSLVLKEITIQQGWNWLSFNLKLVSPKPDSLLKDLNSVDNNIFKNQIEFVQYAPGFGWFGSLLAVNNTSMYQLRANKKDTIIMIGMPIDPDSLAIPLAVGWNWISYIPRVPQPINTALSGITVLNGDIIKSQTQFAQYVAGFGFLGNLAYLVPGEGYLLKTSLTDTLQYPDNNFLIPKPDQTTSDGSSSSNTWIVDPHKFEYSSTLIGYVRKDNLNVTDSNWELAGFVDKECRGTSKAIWVEPLQAWLFFLTTYSNNPGELVKFKAFNGSNIVELNEQLYFAIDAQIGSIFNPFIFNIQELTGVSDKAKDGSYFYIEPNPTTQEGPTKFIFSTGETEDIVFEIFDQSGKKVYGQLVNANQSRNEFVFSKDILLPGFYTVRLNTARHLLTNKLIIR
jgi:hypothetical protein